MILLEAYLWAFSMGSTGIDNGLHVELANDGNILLFTTYSSTVDFDPGAGVDNSTSNGITDMGIAKYSPSGQFIWMKTIGNHTYDWIQDVGISKDGNIYMTGYFSDTLDIDPDTGVHNIVSAGGFDGYMMKLDANGNFIWANRHGGTGNDYGFYMDCYETNDVYYSGIFQYTADFEYKTGGDTMTAAGGYDIFFAKVSSCKDTFAYTVSACDSFLFDQHNLTIDGIYYKKLYSSQGCDSIVELDLTIDHPTTSTDQQTVCNSYTWIDGNTYTSSNNTAIHTVTNSQGCDSIITLDLTISNSTVSTDVQTACDSFTWINGVTYTSSNNSAKDTLVNATGCDSIVSLDLTINFVNDSITGSGVDISAIENGLTYQWLDCDNSFSIIAGETNQNFTATTNGNYAVEVTGNGCVDTSTCFAVTNASINEGILSNISVYPNPTKSVVSLNFGDVIDQYSIQVLNVLGEELGSFTTQKNQSDIQLELDNVNGLYFIKISNSLGNTRIVRVVKE